MKTEKIFIEKIVYGGLGMGRLSSGKIVLTEGALPQEELIVTIQQQKKNHLFGKIKEILVSHPKRVIPACPYKKCGGCNLHHTDYQEQLAIKELILSDILQREDKKLAEEISFCRKPILASNKQFGYRQRIRLQIDKMRPGFRARSSHDCITINKCLLAEASLNKTLCQLLNIEKSKRLLAIGEELELLLDPKEQEVVAVLHAKRQPRPQEKAIASQLVENIPELNRFFFVGKHFAIQGPFPEENRDRHLCYQYLLDKRQIEVEFEVGAFCQVNLKQNKKLIDTVVQFARIEPGEKVLDLYCGMGNFSLPLAAAGANVIGIEGQAAAIRSARRNARRAELPIQFEKMPVESACKKLVENRNTFDTLLIDPPRRGTPELSAHFFELTTKKLIYISCDPVTLARDLSRLKSKGFVVTGFQPVDMFPQTHHIECVVLLEKKR